MKIRFSKRALVAAAFVATTGFLVSTASAQGADEMERMLKDGAQLLQRGRTKEANAQFRRVLASDPSNEDAYNLVKSTDFSVFLDMLKAGGESEQVAARLLELSHRAETAKSQDASAIRGLVNTAVHEKDLGRRTKACQQLAASHGEYAVPTLVGYLGSNDIDVRANAIICLTAIGTDAVTPLAASLGSAKGMQKKNTALILDRIGDERAGPALLAAAGKTAAAAKAYMGLSAKYFLGDPQTLRNYDGTWTVWSADGGALTGRDVPRFIYNYEMAEQAAYDALAAAPGMDNARAMIALCAFAEVCAWEGLSADAMADESLAETKKALGGAEALAASTGSADLLNALGWAMELGHGDAAAKISGAIADLGSAGDLNGKNMLVRALTNDDKTVRYGSAMALANLDPAAGFPKSNMVASILGEAAGEVSIRQVLVIDSDSKNAMNTQRALNKAGFHAVAASSGAGGLRVAQSAGGFDAIVIRNTLSDITTFQVLDELKRDFRTSSAKTVVMASGGNAGADYDSRGVAAIAPTSADSVGVVNAVKEALGDSTDAAAAAGNALSIAASNALAGVRGNAFKLGDAQKGLLSALREGAPDDVRLAALGALANMANADAAGALTGVVSRTENSAAVRAAAAGALGRALKGQAPSATAFRALVEAMGDEDGGVSAAAGRALGGSKLTDAQRNEVVRARRVN